MPLAFHHYCWTEQFLIRTNRRRLRGTWAKGSTWAIRIRFHGRRAIRQRLLRFLDGLGDGIAFRQSSRIYLERPSWDIGLKLNPPILPFMTLSGLTVKRSSTDLRVRRVKTLVTR